MVEIRHEIMFKVTICDLKERRTYQVSSVCIHRARDVVLSSVINSERAIQVNIAIMRTFVKLRAMLASNTGLARYGWTALPVKENCRWTKRSEEFNEALQE